MDEKPKEKKKCFAWKNGSCTALRDIDLPEYCERCKFRKPKQYVTNGKKYPYIDKYGR